MGQETFYCLKCKSLVRTRDLEEGRAFRVGAQVACADCHEGPPATPSRKRRPSGSSTAVQRPGGDTPRRGNLPPSPGTTTSRRRAPARNQSATGVVVGIVSGVLVLAILVVAVASGGSTDRPRKEVVSDPSSEPPVAGTVSPPESPPAVPRPAPVEKPGVEPEARARKALESLRAFIRREPDLQAQLRQCSVAAVDVVGTSLEADVEEIRKGIEKRIAETGATAPDRPTRYRSINLGGEPVVIDGVRWEGNEAPNCSITGTPRKKEGVTLDPPTDPGRAAMMKTFAYKNGDTRVTLTKVPAGRYDVFLYLWEDSVDDPQTFDILVNGAPVRKGYRTGEQGSWERLGPFRVEVTDGRLEIRSNAAAANFSGLEVWRAEP